MKFRNAIIKEVGIKPSNTVDRPARLEMTFIFGDETEISCYIRMNDANFAYKLVKLMSFTNADDMNDIAGKYVRIVIDGDKDITHIGDILKDKYFKIEGTKFIQSELETFTEEDIKELENK